MCYVTQCFFLKIMPSLFLLICSKLLSSSGFGCHPLSCTMLPVVPQVSTSSWCLEICIPLHGHAFLPCLPQHIPHRPPAHKILHSSCCNVCSFLSKTYQLRSQLSSACLTALPDFSSTNTQIPLYFLLRPQRLEWQVFVSYYCPEAAFSKNALV